MDEKIFENKKLVVLDLDGTLGKLNVDWVSSRKIFKDYSLKEFGISFEDGMRLDEMENSLVNEFGMDQFDKIFHKRKLLEEEGVINSKINLELVKKMKELKCKNIKIAIYSNNLLETVQRFLSFHQLEKLVDLCVGINEQMPPKPNPVGMRKILSQMGVDVENTLFIGDNPSTDEEIAKIFKMPYLEIKMQ